MYIEESKNIILFEIYMFLFIYWKVMPPPPPPPKKKTITLFLSTNFGKNCTWFSYLLFLISHRTDLARPRRRPRPAAVPLKKHNPQHPGGLTGGCPSRPSNRCKQPLPWQRKGQKTKLSSKSGKQKNTFLIIFFSFFLVNDLQMSRNLHILFTLLKKIWCGTHTTFSYLTL